MNKYTADFTADMKQTHDNFREVISLALDGLMDKIYHENDKPLFHTFQLSCTPDYERNCILIKTEMECSPYKTVEQMMLSPSFIDVLKNKNEQK